MKRSRTLAGVCVALAAATAALVWWLAPQQTVPGAVDQRMQIGAATVPPGGAIRGQATRPMEDSFFAARRAADLAHSSDPLLVDGLRDTLEALLMQAQDDGAADPATLKQRLAALVGQHFPAALVARALALAERYVDYRVALGQLRAPQDVTAPYALRESLEARHKVRQQFFDGPEHDALFAREADLDRYTLARLEIARNTELTAEQRALALRQADNELPEARRAERAATTEHLNAAAQTAAFNAQNTDERTRHAARSAQYGETAAHAMAQLDREEQHWQQRLDQYSQAQTQQGDGAALQQLRQQLFSPEEQQRIEAALALRKLRPSGS
jgi:lipase chaperone LimK